MRFLAVTPAFSLGILSISDLFIGDPSLPGNEVHEPPKHPHVGMHIVDGTLVLMLHFRLLPLDLPGLSDADEVPSGPMIFNSLTYSLESAKACKASRKGIGSQFRTRFSLVESYLSLDHFI